MISFLEQFGGARADTNTRAQLMVVTSHGVIPIEQARMYAEREMRASLGRFDEADWIANCEGQSQLPDPDRCEWCSPAACNWPQCRTAGGSGPTVPWRRSFKPTRPHLSTWRRLVLGWTRLCACF